MRGLNECGGEAGRGNGGKGAAAAAARIGMAVRCKRKIGGEEGIEKHTFISEEKERKAPFCLVCRKRGEAKKKGSTRFGKKILSLVFVASE